MGGRFVRSTCYATGLVLTGLVSLGFLTSPIASTAGEPEPASRIHSISSAPASPKATLTWVGCGIAKTAFMVELAATYAEKTGVEIKLKGGGATRGIRDTAAGRSDMGGSCRHALPVDAEENVILVPVGWDALVVIVNPANPVEEITLAELKAVLGGDVRNWKELRGPDEEIQLVIREQGPGGKISGVGLMTRELVFFDRDKDYTDAATAVTSTGPLEQLVEETAWAMGVTGISSAKRRQVKMLHLDGVAPSYENLTAHEYPLFRPLYLVLPKRSEKKRAAEEFAAFALGDEAQAILKANGTVTLEDGALLWKEYRVKMLEAGVRMGDY